MGNTASKLVEDTVVEEIQDLVSTVDGESEVDNRMDVDNNSVGTADESVSFVDGDVSTAEDVDDQQDEVDHIAEATKRFGNTPETGKLPFGDFGQPYDPSTNVYEEDIFEYAEENNEIIDVFAEQFEIIARAGLNVLSAWLWIGAHFHLEKKAGTWRVFDLTDERKDELRAKYGERLLDAATWSVEDVSTYTAKLGENGIKMRPAAADSPRIHQLLRQYCREGFDTEDLVMEYRRLLGTSDSVEEAVDAFEEMFDNLAAETRLLVIAPALQVFYEESDTPATPISPGGQLRSPYGPRPSFRSLLTALKKQNHTFTSSPTTPKSLEVDFIPLGSPTPPGSPAVHDPEQINDKIIAAFGEDFQWLNNRGWAPEVSWRFVSSMVRLTIQLTDGNVDLAIEILKDDIRAYSKNPKDIEKAIGDWRQHALVAVIGPARDEIPDVGARLFFRNRIDGAILDCFDVYWLLREWNKFKPTGISQCNSIPAWADAINDFTHHIETLNAQDELSFWVPGLFGWIEGDNDSTELGTKGPEDVFGQEPSLEDIIIGGAPHEQEDDDDEDNEDDGDDVHKDPPLQARVENFRITDDIHEELTELAESVAAIASSVKVLRKGDDISKGIAFITFKNPEHAWVFQSLQNERNFGQGEDELPLSITVVDDKGEAAILGQEDDDDDIETTGTNGTGIDISHPIAIDDDSSSTSSLPPMPPTPRPSDINPQSPGPRTPTFSETFDTLTKSKSSKRPTSRYRDPRLPRVDPLRYQNRLEEPRRLPKTPTASHLPPAPYSHRRKTPEPRACVTCGRAFRKSKAKGKKTVAGRVNKAKKPAAAKVIVTTRELRSSSKK